MNIHKYNRLFKILISSIIFISTIGCEDDQGPLTSDTITIVVNSINQSDINEQGIIEKDENISNGTGNPWGEFIKDAESEFGKLPQNFEIVSATVQLSDTEGISSFDEIVSGKMSVRFLSTQGSDTDAEKVEIGSLRNPQGSSVIELNNLASISDLNILKERLQDGDFHVGFWCESSFKKNDTFGFDVIIKFIVKVSK